MFEGLSLIGKIFKNNPTVVWIMKWKIVMTFLIILSDSRDLPISHLLPLHSQWSRMVKHSRVQPDGRPTYGSTQSDQMIHVSLLTD